jgi:autotransporter-associated beta strand protein
MKSPFAFCVVVLTFLSGALSAAYADSATWNLSATSSDWNTAINWTPASVPDGPNDTATFDVSSTTAISFSEATQVNGIVFNPAASAFTFTMSPNLNFIISGAGIENNSGNPQNFVFPAVGDFDSALIEFRNDASAGDDVIFIIQGNLSGFANNSLYFYSRSSAGAATIINEGGRGAAYTFGGSTSFSGDSSTDHATVIVNGGLVEGAIGGEAGFGNTARAGNGTFMVNAATVSGAFGGSLHFNENSTAADATVVGNGGVPENPYFRGGTFFHDTTNAGNANITMNGGTFSGAVGALLDFDFAATASNATITSNAGTIEGAGGGITTIAGDAANATLIANGGAGDGGSIQFRQMGTGGTAKVMVYSNGSLDINGSRVGGVTIGSLEGDGQVFLGTNNLSVGSNNLTTTFLGTIQEGGLSNGQHGQFTKVGRGFLTLTGVNTYRGGTTVSAGGLLVNNMTGSGTGTRPVQVNSGTLGGHGSIAGAVTVGTGSGTGAFLAPAAGTNKRATLTIRSSLTFNSDATYTYTYRAKNSTASTDLVVANGVTINSGATLDFDGMINGRLMLGLVFTLIRNTSANPISGTFSNLPDGSTVVLAGNTFQADYEGGDGNDLTLTVGP